MKFLFERLGRSGASIAACGLLLMSCGPKAANFSILPAGQSTYQGNIANNKVDILWVIDNSGSMLTKQQNLAAGFNSFANVFVNKGFDFRMAIVTSDTKSAGAGGQQGEFQGTPKIISSNNPSFASIFQTNVIVGAGGDSAAKELDAIDRKSTRLNSSH